MGKHQGESRAEGAKGKCHQGLYDGFHRKEAVKVGEQAWDRLV